MKVEIDQGFGRGVIGWLRRLELAEDVGVEIAELVVVLHIRERERERFNRSLEGF